MGAPSPDISFADLRRLAITVATRTKHGPNSSGRNGPCDADCVKCIAERWAGGDPHSAMSAVMAREVEHAERRFAANDDIMAAALRGEPFWGADKAPVAPEQIVGLAYFVPNVAPAPLAIERYVRGQLEIGYDVEDPENPLLDGPVFGHLELGLHYADGEKPSEHRSRLLELAEEACGAVLGDRYDAHLAAWQDRRENPSVLDEDIADTLTRDLDARIVAAFGDRPRFIEVWRGDVEDEPLTQVYAPHGMPRWR